MTSLECVIISILALLLTLRTANSSMVDGLAVKSQRVSQRIEEKDEQHQELFPTLKVMVEINGVQVPAIIDTGTHIDHRFYKSDVEHFNELTYL
jgi:hypothetical protein